MGADSKLLTLALKTRMAPEAARADLPRRGWRCAVGRNSPWRGRHRGKDDHQRSRRHRPRYRPRHCAPAEAGWGIIFVAGLCAAFSLELSFWVQGKGDDLERFSGFALAICEGFRARARAGTRRDQGLSLGQSREDR